MELFIEMGEELMSPRAWGEEDEVEIHFRHRKFCYAH